MKRPLMLVAIILVFALQTAAAASERPSYLELSDAPIISVDWSKGTTQAVTLHGNRTFVFANGLKGAKRIHILNNGLRGLRQNAATC